jgi:hypothetical protein
MVSQTIERNLRQSRMRLARVTGALYLPLFVLGPFSLVYIRDTVTADRLGTHGGLLRAGSVIELYMYLTDIALAALFYLLLRPVNPPLALVAAYLRLAYAAVAMVTVLTNVAALQDRGDAQLYLDLHRFGLTIGFVAFGAHLVVLGYAFWMSNLLPRPVGVLVMVAGAGYVLNSLLVLGWGTPTQPLILLPAVPGELSLSLWLLVKGVRER